MHVLHEENGGENISAKLMSAETVTGKQVEWQLQFKC